MFTVAVRFCGHTPSFFVRGRYCFCNEWTVGLHAHIVYMTLYSLCSIKHQQQKNIMESIQIELTSSTSKHMYSTIFYFTVKYFGYLKQSEYWGSPIYNFSLSDFSSLTISFHVPLMVTYVITFPSLVAFTSVRT